MMNDWLLWYLAYMTVTIWLTFRIVGKRPARITGWKAVVIMPAFLPLFLIGWAIGTHHAYLGRHDHSVGIELGPGKPGK